MSNFVAISENIILLINKESKYMVLSRRDDDHTNLYKDNFTLEKWKILNI